MSSNRRFKTPVGGVNYRSNNRGTPAPRIRDIEWAPPQTSFSGDRIPWGSLNVTSKGPTGDMYLNPDDGVLWAGDVDGAQVVLTIVAPPSDDRFGNHYNGTQKTAMVRVSRRERQITWRVKPVWEVGEALTPATLNLGASAGNATFTLAEPADGALAKAEDVLKITVKADRNAWYKVAEASTTVKVVADVKGLASGSGSDMMTTGQAWNGPPTAEGQAILANWDTDKDGMKTQGQKITSDLTGKTADELIAYMDTLAGTGAGNKTQQGGEYPNTLWQLPNGLQVRYKSNGDKRNIGTPMYCVEGKITPGFSTSPGDIAFKVATGGTAAPPGPPPLAPQWVIDSPQDVREAYNRGACNTTHLKCEPKSKQKITWDRPDAIEAGAPLSATQLCARAEDNAVLTYKTGTGAVVKVGDELPAGDNQITVVAAATRKYEADATGVAVLITVTLKKQKLAWKTPADIFAGAKLTAAQLNATAEDNAARTYWDATGKEVNLGDILPAGDGQTLTVKAKATPRYAAEDLGVTVTINVKGVQPQRLGWENPADIVVGTKLSGTQLNAKCLGGAELTYWNASGKELKDGSALPVGDGQQLTVKAKATAGYAADDVGATVTINVKKPKQVITWTAPEDIELGAGLSDKQLNATCKDVSALTYWDAAGTELEIGDKLPLGDGQKLTVKATETDRFAADDVGVTVAINVKLRKQRIAWKKPADIFAGTALGETQLNAIPQGKPVLTYRDANGGEVTVGTILPVGKAQKLTVTAAATDSFAADDVGVTVAITVKPAATATSPAASGTTAKPQGRRNKK